MLCHTHNGTPEHTTGTGFVPGGATSEAPVAVGLCVLTSGASRQAEWRHSARTAVSPAGIQRYPQGPSYTDPTCIQTERFSEMAERNLTKLEVMWSNYPFRACLFQNFEKLPHFVQSLPTDGPLQKMGLKWVVFFIKFNREHKN